MSFSGYRRRKSEGPNREGLTWAEWAAAAGLTIDPWYRTCGVRYPRVVLTDPSIEETRGRWWRRYFLAWERGEDPTEYRAEIAAA